jgi:hypothetical protein
MDMPAIFIRIIILLRVSFIVFAKLLYAAMVRIFEVILGQMLNNSVSSSVIFNFLISVNYLTSDTNE